MIAYAKSRIFKKFLLSYVCILLLPLATGFFVYSEAISIISAQDERSKLAILEHGMTIIDSQFQSIESVADSISMNRRVRNISTYSSPLVAKNNLTDFVEVQRDIQIFKQNNDFIRNIMTFFVNSDVFITDSSIYMRPHMYYGEYFSYNNMSYDGWYKLFNETYLKNFLPEGIVFQKDALPAGAEHPVILFIQSYPFWNPTKITASIAIFISKHDIQDCFNGLNLNDGGAIVIIDSNNNKLVTIGDEKIAQKVDFSSSIYQSLEGNIELRTDDGEFTVSYLTAPRNGWKYIAVLPTGSIMQQATYIKNTIFFFLCLSLIVGLFAAFLFSRQNMKPLSGLIYRFGAKTKERDTVYVNEYEFIQTRIDDIILNNEKMKFELDKQAPLLKSSIFYRLLYESEVNDEDIKTLMGGFDNGVYIIGIMKLQIDAKTFSEYSMIDNNDGTAPVRTQYSHSLPFDSSNSMAFSMVKVIAKIIIQETMFDLVHTADIDIDKIALMLRIPSDNINDYKSIINAMADKSHESLIDCYGIDAHFYFGGIFDEICNIQYSFDEAKKSTDQMLANNSSIVTYYTEQTNNNMIYFFPSVLENKLINLVKSGNTVDTLNMIDTLYTENFINRELSGFMVGSLISEIIAAQIKAIAQLNTEVFMPEEFIDTITGFHGIRSWDGLRESIAAICENINMKLGETKKNASNKLMMDILRFIDDNYKDHQFSLNMVSDKFDISEQYLSTIFKKFIGANFFSYVETKRNEEAIFLLSNTEISVEEIASLVGYNSANAFRKAFKRINGVIPSQFRTQR